MVKSPRLSFMCRTRPGSKKPPGPGPGCDYLKYRGWFRAGFDLIFTETGAGAVARAETRPGYVKNPGLLIFLLVKLDTCTNSHRFIIIIAMNDIDFSCLFTTPS